MSPSRGFTMVETVLAITVVGLIATVTALTFSPVLDSWVLGSPRGEAVESTSYALNRMIGEIAQIKDTQSVIAASATAFRFVDTRDEDITYSLNGGNLMRNGNVLARNIQGLGLQYRNVGEALLASPAVSPSATDIWRVAVSLTASAAGQTISMTSSIHPRNFPRPGG